MGKKPCQSCEALLGELHRQQGRRAGLLAELAECRARLQGREDITLPGPLAEKLFWAIGEWMAKEPKPAKRKPRVKRKALTPRHRRRSISPQL